MAVAEFLASGGYDRHMRRLRAALATNVERYGECIATEFPEGARVSAPSGGFVLWVEPPPGVDARAPRSGAALADRCRAGSAVPPRQRFTNVIRISAGAPWSERIADGLRTLARLVARE
jgi:DNA-binding transcriptional MocR family regulator